MEIVVGLFQHESLRFGTHSSLFLTPLCPRKAIKDDLRFPRENGVSRAKGSDVGFMN